MLLVSCGGGKTQTQSFPVSMSAPGPQPTTSTSQPISNNNLRFNAASSTEVKQANCMPVPPTEVDAQFWFESKNRNATDKASFRIVHKGVSFYFKDQSRELAKAFMEMHLYTKNIQPSNFMSYLVPTNMPSEMLEASENCEDISCMLGYSKSPFPYLHLLAKYKFGVSLSPYQIPGGTYANEQGVQGVYHNRPILSEQVIQQIFMGFGAYPNSKFPLHRTNLDSIKKYKLPINLREIEANVWNFGVSIVNTPKPFLDPSSTADQRIYRYHNVPQNEAFRLGITLTGEMIYSEDSIVHTLDISLNNYWRVLSLEDTHKGVTTMVHELAHAITSNQHLMDSWISNFGWSKKISETQPGSFTWELNSKWKNSLCSQYGSNQPSEDIAECSLTYRFNPSSLNAKKYAFLKKHLFNGVEYKTPSACQDSMVDFYEDQSKPNLYNYIEWEAYEFDEDIVFPL